MVSISSLLILYRAKLKPGVTELTPRQTSALLVRRIFNFRVFKSISKRLYFIMFLLFYCSLYIDSRIRSERSERSLKATDDTLYNRCPFDLHPLHGQQNYQRPFRFHVYKLSAKYSEDIIRKITPVCTNATDAFNHFCDSYYMAKNLRLHPCHTEDPEEADLFFVPLQVRFNNRDPG